MQNEQHLQSSGDTEGKLACQRPEEEKWSEFAHDLEMLGHQLSELSSHTAVLGYHIIQRLDAQYQAVRNRADVLKQTTDQQIDELRKLVCHQGRDARGALSDIRARSKATAFEIWERSEPFRQGAQDVGEGLVRAWAELRASFGKAANRISSSEARVSPRPAEEQVPDLPKDPSERAPTKADA
jgi:hypothetical protein